MADVSGEENGVYTLKGKRLTSNTKRKEYSTAVWRDQGATGKSGRRRVRQTLRGEGKRGSHVKAGCSWRISYTRRLDKTRSLILALTHQNRPASSGHRQGASGPAPHSRKLIPSPLTARHDEHRTWRELGRLGLPPVTGGYFRTLPQGFVSPNHLVKSLFLASCRTGKPRGRGLQTRN